MIVVVAVVADVVVMVAVAYAVAIVAVTALKQACTAQKREGLGGRSPLPVANAMLA